MQNAVINNLIKHIRQSGLGITVETARFAITGRCGVCVLAQSVLRDMSMCRLKICLAFLAAVVAMAAGLTHAMGQRDSAPAVSITNDDGRVLLKEPVIAGKLVQVWSVAWRPDGEQIASGGFDGSVRIWSVAGKVTRVLKGHQRPVTSVVWSPDNTKLASAGFDGTVRIWNRDGTPGPVMKGHNGVVAAVAWSADGKRLASGGFADNTVRIWSADGKPEAVLKRHTRRVSSVAWHPKGNVLASGSYDGTVRLWDAHSRPFGPRVLKGGGGIIYSVVWGQNGVLLAAGNHDGSIGLWNMGFAEIVEGAGPSVRIEAHDAYVLSLNWSQDGLKLVSSGADKTVRIWNARFKSKFVFKGHDNPPQRGNRYSHHVNSVSWSPDQKHVVSGGMDGTIRLWDAETGKLVWVRGATESAPAPHKTKDENPKQSATGPSVNLLNAKLPVGERAHEAARLIAEYVLTQAKIGKSKIAPKVTKHKSGWLVRYDNLGKQIAIRVLDKTVAEFKRLDKNGNGQIDGKDFPEGAFVFRFKPGSRLKGADLKNTADLLKRIDKRIAALRSKYSHLTYWDRPIKTVTRKFGGQTTVSPDPKSSGKLLRFNTTDPNGRHELYYRNRSTIISLRIVHRHTLIRYNVTPAHLEYGNAAVIVKTAGFDSAEIYRVIQEEAFAEPGLSGAKRRATIAAGALANLVRSGKFPDLRWRGGNLFLLLPNPVWPMGNRSTFLCMPQPLRTGFNLVIPLTAEITELRRSVAPPKKNELPPGPNVKDKTWPRNAVDFYVLAKFEAKYLKPSPEASRYALARRASLTLTGLPPSLDQLKRFLGDKPPNAYEAMIDRLLKSKAHRDYWAIMTAHHEKPTDVKHLAQAESWAAVLWQQVFGRELKPASHPHLKEYLTTQVQTQSDAKLLRLLLTSATYRQSSEMNQDLLKADRDNEWLARYPRTRLPSWVISRGILFLSGLSNEDEKLVPYRQLKPEPKKKKPPAIPPSALILITPEWVQKASAAIARQVLTKGGKSDEDRFRYAALLVLGRPPTKHEKSRVTTFIRDRRKQHAKDAKLPRRMAKLGIEFPGDLVEAAIWIDLSLVLVNTAEFAFKR